MKKFFCVFTLNLYLICCTTNSYCQDKFGNRDFSQVDNFARSIKYENDLIQLTNTLTVPYPEKIDKLRSIFIWISENIAYDYEFINKGKEFDKPRCTDKINCANEIREWENAYLKKLLKQKEGICDGYSRLLKRMCEQVGIECSVVPGYVKQKPYQIGIPLTASHAWNAVLIDSAYYYLDPTWAAGFCVENEEKRKITSYQKSYNNYYWLTPFHKLVRNHYPKDGQWVVKENYTKEKFFNNPYYAGNILPKIELLSPATGMLNYKKGDTVQFAFKYTGDIKLIQVNSNGFRNPAVLSRTNNNKVVLDEIALKKQVYLPFTKTGDVYQFEYINTGNDIYYLEVLFDYKTVLRFKNSSEKK